MIMVLLSLACKSDKAVTDGELFTPAPLRRMTSAQYNNTLRDLFPEQELPKQNLPSAELSGFFDNNTELNRATSSLVTATQEASLYTVIRLSEQGYFPSCENYECAEAFLSRELERIWRRPPEESELEKQQQQWRLWSEENELELVMLMGLQELLQSPEFLYFPEYGLTATGEQRLLTGHELASRMSYFLWNTMPDQQLLELAAADQLSSRAEVVEQAWRMLNDERAEQGVLQFHRQWLELDRIGSNVVDFQQIYIFEGQEEAPEAVSDYLHQILQPQMRQEPELFIVEHLLNGAGTLSNLLLSRQAFVTPELAELYGVEIPEGAGEVLWESELVGVGSTDDFEGYLFEELYYAVELPENERAGLLTMLGLLHAASHPAHPSPVQRGVFILERFLCFQPPPPPDDVPPLEITESSEPLTNRERYAQHTNNPACASCHEVIDGVGFTFERYDVLGRYQEEVNAITIDNSGELVVGDVKGELTSALHLVAKLSNSRDVHDCVTEQWLQYALARNEWGASEQQNLAQLQEGFWTAGGDIPELLVNIVGSSSFRSLGGPND